MSVVRYLNPWKLKRERAAERLAALRNRDGDNCARCRRPMRFDLPPGHDQGARIEVAANSEKLCHNRCAASGVDHTDEVLERRRKKNETEIFAKARRRRKKAA